MTKFLTCPTYANVLESKEVIGSIGVVSYDEKINMVYIGYCIGKKWWHKDVTSEALKYIIQFF